MWSRLPGLLSLVQLLSSAVAGAAQDATRQPAQDGRASSWSSATAISLPLFLDLERMSRVADIAYCVGNTGVRKPFECLSRCNEFPELSLVTTWSTGLLLTDSCGYIAVDHDPAAAAANGVESSSVGGSGAIIVAFRGTYSITNTVVDLGTMPQIYMPYPAPGDDGQEPRHKCVNCTVHMGFLESWRNAREVVLPELKALKAKYPLFPVHLVGHSLGGAVACLAALELKVSLGWEDVIVTTFGEPRVGNYQLARFIDEWFDLDADKGPDLLSYRRVTHNGDPVPLLPWDEWGYRSHAGEIYIAKPGLPPSADDLRTCVGDNDTTCSTGTESHLWQTIRRLLHFGKVGTTIEEHMEALTLPARFRLWQLFFAHRDYFWRLGLCVPGGDPENWGRGPLATAIEPDEL